MGLWKLSAIAQAKAVATGEVSSVELIDAHIARINEVNGRLNAVTRVLETARDDAAKADEAVARGDALGPLHGVPFSIKENLDVVGSPTTEGLVAFADAMPTQNAPVVERMQGAGAVALSRTNLPELGLRVHTDSGLHGLTRNPHHQDRTAGGSSGGEGSSLASGMSPIGLGNDIGGSLRNPAFCCGVASLKPTFGRIPSAKSIEPRSGSLAGQLMAVDGPMARTIADVRLGFEVLAGPHPRDPWTIPAPLVGPPVSKRVALVPEPAGGQTDSSISQSVRNAGQALQDQGYEVEEISPPMLEEAAQLWGNWLGGELLPMLPLLDMVMSDDAKTFVTNARNLWPDPTHESAVELLLQRHVVARAWAEFFVDWPIIVGPVWCQPSFEHGFDISSQESTAAVIDLLRFVVPTNVLGLPTAVVGAGKLDDGMPAAVQVIADRCRDDICLDVAEVIEGALGAAEPIDPAW